MGRSDPYLNHFYKKNIYSKGTTALLGFVQQGKFGLHGDLYDYQLNNWEINSSWKLKKKYDTIICLRSAYFSKNPKSFIDMCFDNLKEDGLLFVDWGLGHHWTDHGYEYKVGWIKDGVQEQAYFKNNYLWSGVWHDSFLKNQEFLKFIKATKLFSSYSDCDIKKVIFEEVPSVLNLKEISGKYQIMFNVLTLWDKVSQPVKKNDPLPQCYILLTMRRRK